MEEANQENKNSRLLPPIAAKVIHEIVSKVTASAVKFLFLNDELLLDATPKKSIVGALKDPNVPGEARFALSVLLRNIDEITKHCNKEIKDLKRIKVKPKGLHVPNAQFLPQEIIQKITNNDVIDFTAYSNEVKDKAVLNTLTEEDIIKPQKGDKLDWLSFMIPDGKVFPYTILPENALSVHGFPIGLYTKGDEDVDPASIKHIYYEDPRIKKIVKGIYFEVYEGPGPKGPGGINGLIVPADNPLVIINHKRKEAYFINDEKSKQGLQKKDLTNDSLMISG